MRLAHILVASAALAVSMSANADTRLIEGKGEAKNREGFVSHFDLRVAQTNDAAASGKFLFTWKRLDAEITVTTLNPRAVRVAEHEGRMEGPAKVTVKRNGQVNSWEGTVFFTGLDLLTKTGANADKVRMRFIRNPFEAPEGDFFFEGPVVSGNLVVKKS